MGQTVRQSMPFNASHAFVHAVVICAELPKHMGSGLNDQNTPAQSECVEDIDQLSSEPSI